MSWGNPKRFIGNVDVLAGRRFASEWSLSVTQKPGTMANNRPCVELASAWADLGKMHAIW